MDQKKSPEDFDNVKANSENLVYVKKWLKTPHALIFKLSNKVLQLSYQDNSELVLSSKSKKVSYLNKKGERTTYTLSEAMKSENKELIKRLNYAR